MLLSFPSPKLAAQLPHLQDWIHELEQCESGGRPDIKILNANKEYSYGILQFQMRTWLFYGKEFGATEENIYDPLLQEQVAEKMLDAGESLHWKACVARTTKKLGPYKKPTRN